jgi:ubiquitin carboxyl-terminal hydrolase L3
MHDRAKMLYDNQEFETAHQSVAELGDTEAPSASEGDRSVYFTMFGICASD